MEKNMWALAKEFESILATGGVHAALAFINQRTRHRFTGLYRFDPPTLRNLQLYDRENPDLQIGANTPMRETYCSIVGEQAAPFGTADATRDDRLRQHPARENVVSYTGVPLRGPDGNPFGTLCHFDFVPQPIAEAEIELLEELGELIMAELQRSGGSD